MGLSQGFNVNIVQILLQTIYQMHNTRWAAIVGGLDDRTLLPNSEFKSCMFRPNNNVVWAWAWNDILIKQSILPSSTLMDPMGLERPFAQILNSYLSIELLRRSRAMLRYIGSLLYLT